MSSSPEDLSQYDSTEELVKINPVPSLIVVMETLKIEVVNAATAELLGYSEEELKGKPLIELVPKEDVPAVIRTTEEPVPEGATQWRCCRKDGSLIYVKVKYRDTLLHGQKARFVVAIATSTSPILN
jgi:PAS domain S-box-containing protein